MAISAEQLRLRRRVRLGRLVRNGFLLSGGSLDHALQQRCVVVAHGVHAHGHGVVRHQRRGKWCEEIADIDVGHIEPALVVGRRHDHRHPVVQRREQRVGLRRDDRAGVEHLALRRQPALRQPGEREEAALLHADVDRLLGTTCAHLPFVETICRQQATVPPVGVAERRLLVNRFGSRIDHLRTDARILGPTGNEAPAHVDEFARACLRVSHHRHLLHRRDVVARQKRRDRADAEGQRDRRRMRVQFVASAHGRRPCPSAVRTARGRWTRRAACAPCARPAACPNTHRRRPRPRPRAAPTGKPRCRPRAG